MNVKESITDASQDKVWQVIAAVDCWPEWQTDINKTKLHGKPAAGSTFSWYSFECRAIL